MTVATDSKLAAQAVHTIKFLAVDAVERANSGHPGMPMGAADVAFVLWSRFLRHDPTAPDWPDRDRFVLSAGHGSMLLYALLHLSGYDLSLDDLVLGTEAPAGHFELEIRLEDTDESSRFTGTLMLAPAAQEIQADVERSATCPRS